VTPRVERDIGQIQKRLRPATGIADLDGNGEVVGGIVIMEHDQNLLAVTRSLEQQLCPIWIKTTSGHRSSSPKRQHQAWSVIMKLSTDRTNGIAIIHVGETKLRYPLLSIFAESVTTLLSQGESNVIVDMSNVVYVDSASIGCLVDLHRQASQAGGALKIAGVQKRVETMLRMTGVHNFIELYPDEAGAVKSFSE
jgi:anti-anti-sigma factor